MSEPTSRGEILHRLAAETARADREAQRADSFERAAQFQVAALAKAWAERDRLRAELAALRGTTP